MGAHEPGFTPLDASVGVLQVDPEVVRGQNRVLADHPQALGAVHPDVAVGPHVHAEVAVETMQAPDRVFRHDPAEGFLALSVD